MFYREYRPQKFSDLIGSDHIVSSITTALNKGTPAHAYFFCGSRGIGKTTTARLLAKSLNCLSPKLNLSKSVLFEPCGECDSCKAVEFGKHLDLIEIDAASNRGIDNIREITDKVMFSPTMGKNKVYIIDEVHMLTTEASNALLKTLEEPPAHAYFILCTTNPEKVLDTIKSRCQQFIFKRPSKDNLEEKLKKILKDQKNSNIKDDDLGRIAMAAKGAYRDAENILEQYINGLGQTDSLIGSSNDNYGYLLELLVNNKRKESLEFVFGTLSKEINPESWLEKFILYMRTVILLKVGIPQTDYTFTPQEIDVIKTANINSLRSIIIRFAKSMEEFRYTGIPTLPIEMAVIEITSDLNDGLSSDRPSSKPDMPQTEIKSSPVSSKGVGVTTSVPFMNPTPKTPVVSKESVIVVSEAIAQASAARKDFPFKALMTSLEETNRSIYLLLGSCRLLKFDGSTLTIGVPYSFHKERLLSAKNRDVIEASSEILVGAKVILSCELLSKNTEALNLTDRNVKITPGDTSLEKVFEEVFGDDVKAPE